MLMFVNQERYTAMRIHVKVVSPTNFHFDNLLSSEISGAVATIAELEKKLTGYLEKAVVIELDSRVWLSGISGQRLLLQPDSELAMMRLLQGKSNWANVYFIPHALPPTPQGIYQDEQLVFIGRAMLTPISSSTVKSKS